MENKVFKFLFKLKRSGITNLWGINPYILNAFPELTKKEAKKLHSYWLKNFKELKNKLNEF